MIHKKKNCISLELLNFKWTDKTINLSLLLELKNNVFNNMLSLGHKIIFFYGNHYYGMFFYKNNIFFEPWSSVFLYQTTCLRKNINWCLYLNNCNNTLYIDRD